MDLLFESAIAILQYFDLDPEASFDVGFLNPDLVPILPNGIVSILYQTFDSLIKADRELKQNAPLYKIYAQLKEMRLE